MLKNPEEYEYLREIIMTFPLQEANLIHGDLWAGNYLITEAEQVIFIDPSISYGNREMDIAMMMHFGGFPSHTIEAYNRIYPLDENWEYRIRMYQLYYLLVHLNMFGISYASSVNSILQFYKENRT